MGLLSGKKGLIMGVANERSIAWGIAKSCSSQGAKLAFTYQGEALKKRIIPLAESVGSNLTLECDVADETAIKEAFVKIKDVNVGDKLKNGSYVTSKFIVNASKDWLKKKSK